MSSKILHGFSYGQRGVPVLVVSRQLGHAGIGITADVYGHLTPEATRAAADALKAILKELGGIVLPRVSG